jgi:hypothetical protein
MNYNNYKSCVILPWGAALDGWPLVCPVVNPGNLSVSDVCVLWQALKDDRCKWIKLEEHDIARWLNANKNSVGKGKLRQSAGSAQANPSDEEIGAGEDVCMAVDEEVHAVDSSPNVAPTALKESLMVNMHAPEARTLYEATIPPTINHVGPVGNNVGTNVGSLVELTSCMLEYQH